MNLSQIILFFTRALGFAIVVSIIFALYFILIKKQKFKNLDFLLKILFVAYLSSLIQITVIRDFKSFITLCDNTYSISSIIFSPFATTIGAFKFSTWQFVYHFVGNMIWFVPFGVLAPLVCKKINNFISITFCGAALSLSIEILQFVFNSGISDIDDIIINSLGAITGYGFYCLFKRMHYAKF